MIRIKLMLAVVLLVSYVMAADAAEKDSCPVDGGCCSAAKSAEVGKPNIVFIFIDDMGYGDPSCFGNTKVATPNIDRLADGGLKLTNFLCEFTDMFAVAGSGSYRYISGQVGACMPILPVRRKISGGVYGRLFEP